FMAGFYDAWIVEKAAALQAQCLRALERLIQMDTERGDMESARSWLEKRASVNPLDSDAAERLIGAYLQARQYEAAAQLGEAWCTRYRQLTGEESPKSVQQIAHEAQECVARAASAAVLRPDALAPPRATLPTPARNQFVGRECELARLLEWLTDPARACITIVGLGGVGKTRLALEAAYRLQARAKPPIFWIALTAIRNPHQIVPLIAQTLRLPPTPNPHDALQRFCTENRPLLFLDNFEHLLPEGAAVIGQLLRRIPELRLCITSRLPLHIEDETLFTLAPLTCTDTPDCPALQLFVERARQTAPEFTLSAENRMQVHALCRHLDGIPLALELTAARLNTLTLSQMLARIQERLRWLRTRRNDIESRHCTMQGVLEATVAMLPRHARRALALLSLLPDVWTLESARAVTGFAAEPLEEALAALCDACLIERVEAEPPRFRMLEIVREYAQSRLQTPSRCAAESRLSAWMLRVARSRAADAYTERLTDWLAFWDETRPLLLRTLDTLEQRDALHSALRLMRATERYWYLRPLHEDALQRLQRWLDSSRLSPYDAVEARLLQMRLLVETGQFQRAQPVANALRAVNRYDPRRSWALFWIVRTAMALSDRPTMHRYWRLLRKRFPCPHDLHLHYAIHYITPYLETIEDIFVWRETGLQLARQTGDPILVGYALEAFIEPLILRGEYTRALRLLNEAEQLYTRLGDALHRCRVLHQQVSCHLALGKLNRAQQILDACAELERALGLSPTHTRWLQAQLWREQGDRERALRYALAEAAALEQQGDAFAAAAMLEQAALCALEQGDRDAALRYSADAQHLYDRHAQTAQDRPRSYLYLYLCACRGDSNALQQLEARVQQCRANGWRPSLATALQYLAEAYAQQGELERARAALHEATQLNQGMGRQHALQQCQRLAERLGGK
ncbi:MAG: hypothetical protein NZ556_08755, partial [Fimbriimonadales bacterium]|nr:hypothetical protein [Fimbriimonadales bacterium]